MARLTCIFSTIRVQPDFSRQDYDMIACGLGLGKVRCRSLAWTVPIDVLPRQKTYRAGSGSYSDLNAVNSQICGPAGFAQFITNSLATSDETSDSPKGGKNKQKKKNALSRYALEAAGGEERWTEVGGLIMHREGGVAAALVRDQQRKHCPILRPSNVFIASLTVTLQPLSPRSPFSQVVV